MSAAPVQDGFRRSVGSGLYLPESKSRIRQVWTRAEWKLLDRVAALCAARGLALRLTCTHPACTNTPLKKVRRPEGLALQCAHADRVFQRG